MGLSASQARLLNLTARMHDIEYKAQNLEAQKLQMANESQQVYKEYEDALNRQKIQFKEISADGSAVFNDASINTLLEAGYRIRILNGNNWYDYSKTNKKYGTYATTATDLNITAASFSGKVEGEVVGYPVASPTSYYKLAETPSDTATKVKVYAFTAATGNVATELNNISLTEPEVLRNLVEAGFIVFEKPMGDGTFTEVNVATDTNLQETSDEVDLKKAEAKYEADMRKINQKDKKFDTDLAAMEAERNAIKTEMETLKSVAKDNVDRTYKLFS